MRFGARSTGEREIPTSLQARRRDSPCSSWATATDRLPSRRRRHQFFASSPLSAWLSSMASASSCLRRRFSSSSALSRLASDTFTPAYLARHLSKVVGETLWRRQSSSSFAPAWCSRTMPMICSSVKRLLRICPPPERRSNRFPSSLALFQGAGSGREVLAGQLTRLLFRFRPHHDRALVDGGRPGSGLQVDRDQVPQLHQEDRSGRMPAALSDATGSSLGLAGMAKE